MGNVVVDQAGQPGVVVDRPAGHPKRLRKHGARAIAHQVAQIGVVDGPAPLADKDGVKRAEQVGRGVDERAVEVEDQGGGMDYRLREGGAI